MLDELKVEKNVETSIRLSAALHGVDESLALNIACAESRFDPSAKNGKSTASGVYQFLDGTWKHYGLKYWGSLEGRSKLVAADNIELAILVLSDVGSTDWNASKHVWKNKPYEKGNCS